MGIQAAMITGDGQAVAKTVPADLDITRYYAHVLPQKKAVIIRKLKADKANSIRQ